MSKKPTEDFNEPNAALKQHIKEACPDFPNTTLNNLQRSLFTNEISIIVDDYYWGGKNKAQWSPDTYSALNAIRTHAIFLEYEPSTEKLIEDLGGIPDDEKHLAIEVANKFKDASLKCEVAKEGEPINKEYIASEFHYKNNKRREGKVGALWHVIRKAAIYDSFRSHMENNGKTVTPEHEDYIEDIIGDYECKDHYLQGALASNYDFCIPEGYTEEQVEERHKELEQELLEKLMVSIDYINAIEDIEEKSHFERNNILRDARSKALEQCPEGTAIHVLTDQCRLEHTLLKQFCERGVKPYSVKEAHNESISNNAEHGL